MKKDFKNSVYTAPARMNKIVLGIEGSGKSTTAWKLAVDVNKNFTYVDARLPLTKPESIKEKLASVLDEAKKSGVMVIDNLHAMAHSAAKKDLIALTLAALDDKNITVIIAADHHKFDSMIQLAEYGALAKKLDGAFRHVLPKIDQREAKVRQQLRAQGFDVPKGS